MASSIPGAASAAEQLSALSLSVPASLDGVLPLLTPRSTAAQLRSAHLALAQIAGLSFSSAPTPPLTPGGGERFGEAEVRLLRDALSSSEEAQRIAALRALGILASLAPESLLPHFDTLLPPLLSSSSPDQAALLVAALLSALASHAATRPALSANSAVREWCETWLDHAELSGSGAKENEGESRATSDIGLLAGLARVKLGGAAPPAPEAGALPAEEEIGSASARAEAKAQAKAERQKAAEATRQWAAQEAAELRASLLALSRARLLASPREGATEQSGEEQPFEEELRHASFMGALEALAHLSAHMKGALSSDDALLKRLCAPELLGSTAARRPVFPQRGGTASTASSASAGGASSYETDPLRPASQRTDGAAAYALASIFCALVAPPVVLSAQEAQMAALRAKASNTQVSPPEDAAVVEARATKLLAAGGAAALVRLVGGQETSGATRDACALALLGLAAPQTRAARAQIAKEGGAKALLALCSLSSSSSPSSSSSSEDEQSSTRALIPAQALARLCISLPTPLLFASPLSPLAPLARLFLSPLSSPLQRFEACLALTNVASLPGVAGEVARAAYQGTNVEQALRERIVASHRLERRAALELLCNLAQEEEVHRVWSGEMEDQTTGQAGGETKQAAARGRLHVLLALCAPSLGSAASSASDDEDQDEARESGTHSESTLRTRLAASGALATLLSSPSACARLLSLRASSLSILARQLEPSVEPPLRAARILSEEEEREERREGRERERERRAEKWDAESAREGAEEARTQLRVRAAAAIGCVAQYAAWLGSSGGGKENRQKLLELKGKVTEAAWLAALEMRKGEKGEVGEMCNEALALFRSVGVQ